MSLFYQIVFILLIVEAGALSLLLAPLPLKLRKTVLVWLSKSKLMAQVRYVMRILFVFVTMLFIDSVINMQKARNQHETGDVKTDGRSDTYIHTKLFYAQRNMYLTGSVLFLSLVLGRFHSMILELVKNEENIEVMKKQMAQSSKEYMRVLDKDSDSDQKIKDLQEELDTIKAKSKDSEVLLKQAKGQHDEYMRLADRYNELEKKLEARGGDTDSKKGN